MNKKKFNENLKKAKNWDGKSRISTDLYRHNYNEIFRNKTETNQETIGNKGIFSIDNIFLCLFFSSLSP